MKKINTLFKNTTVFFILLITVSIQAQNTPFNCVYDAYLFQYNDVYSIDLASGNSYLVATDITPANINAAAYNTADGYIWGSLKSPSKTIVRIGNDFKTTTYEIPQLTNNNCYIGAISLNGIYHLKSGGSSFDKVDLNPNSETYTQYLGTFNLSQNINIHDWAFNAVDENLYTVEKETNILYRINPADGTVTSLGEVPILTGLNYTYGAVYFDLSGRFYVSSNQTGTIYAIQSVQDLDGNTAINSNLFAFGPSSGSNDGARCPTAPVAQEICDNGIDDDGDGLVDCEDASCSNVGDCDVIIPPTSGGNEGGLESNNRLSNQINKRNYNRSKNNYKFNRAKAKKVIKTKTYAKKGTTDISLQNFIPLDIINETQVIESTPSDLIGITNATEVYAVDYMKNDTSIAAILALKTDNGVYEHTKYICDRLLGAELLSVSTIEINEQSFIKSIIKNTDETIEFVLSFSAKTINNNQNFAIESHWNLDKYEENQTFYNFQIWSNSLDDLYKLGQETLQLLNIEKPITSYNNSTPPTVFVKKGTYKNGNLNLQVINTNATKEVTFDAGIRATETSTINHVSTPINLSAYINNITVETNSLFDIGFRIGDGVATPDDIFMSDGSWGIDDASAGTTINYYEVSQNTNDINTDDFAIERNITLEATINDYVAVYRSLTPRFKPVDVSDFTHFSLKAKGSGNLEIVFIKKSIENWENQPRFNIALNDNLNNYTIPFSELNNSNTLNDVVTVVFKTISDTGETVTKNLQLEEVRFSKNNSLSTEEHTHHEQQIIAIPNPMVTSSTINFYATSATMLTFEIYNQMGTTVYSAEHNSNIGNNTIKIHKNNLSSGLYFCSLKSNNKQYHTLKLLIK